MTMNKRQTLAVAGLVLAGLLGTGAVLWTGRGDTAGEHHDEGPAAQRAAGQGGAGHAGAAHAEAGQHEQGHTTTAQAEAGHAETGHSDAAHTEPANAQPQAAGQPASAAGQQPVVQPGARQITLSAAQRQAAGITLQAAGAATLQAVAAFPGEIRFNEDRMAHVVPRLAGVAQAVRADLGQQVVQGQVLAVIASPMLSDQRSELLTAQKRRALAASTAAREQQLWQDGIAAAQDHQQAQSALQEAEIAVQNAAQKLAAVGAPALAGTLSGGAAGSVPQGLSRLDIRAPFAGTVVEKHLSVGEAVKDDLRIFTVADLRTVWAEFAVAPKDLALVHVGQRVRVSSTAFAGQADGRIAYVGALLGEQTRTARARVTLANPQGTWRPGLFVTVSVLGAGQAVPVAVPADAVQTVDGQTMLFVATPTGFTARPVQVGRNDGKAVEVLAGVAAGEQVAVANSFILKSELGKASAGHGH